MKTKQTHNNSITHGFNDVNNSPNYNRAQQYQNAQVANDIVHNQQEENIRRQQEALEQLRIRQEQEIEYQKQVQYAREKAYHDAYIQDLKNRGYKIRYKKTFKDYLTGFVSLIAIAVIFFILWHIPFVKDFFITFYESTPILNSLFK